MFACDANIPSIPVANVQSLIQLAAALNAGYFAFRAANTEYYKYLDSQVDRISKIYSEFGNVNHPEINQIWPKIFDVRNSINNRNRFYRIFDRLMIYIGYCTFALMCILLLIATLNSTYCVSQTTVFLISIAGYIPSLTTIIVEMIFRHLSSRADNLVFKIENTANKIQKELATEAEQHRQNGA